MTTARQQFSTACLDALGVIEDLTRTPALADDPCDYDAAIAAFRGEWNDLIQMLDGEAGWPQELSRDDRRLLSERVANVEALRRILMEELGALLDLAEL